MGALVLVILVGSVVVTALANNATSREVNLYIDRQVSPLGSGIEPRALSGIIAIIALDR